MPMYDRLCACGWTKADSWERIADLSMSCPSCGGETVRCRLQGGTVHITRDEIPGGFTDENLTSTPVTYYSKSERRRLMKEFGVEEKIRHVGYDGADKSPHTIRWDAAPTQDPRPFCMLTPDEQAIRHAEWWKDEPEPTLRNVILYPPDPESSFTPEQERELHELTARVL